MAVVADENRFEDIVMAQRAASGDADAFRSLVERYSPAVVRFCRLRLGSPEDAEDAAQDVFLRAYRSLPGFRLGSSFSSWIFAIAANRVKSRYSARESRERLRERCAIDAGVSMPAAEEDLSAEMTAIENIEAGRIRAAVGLLPVALRRVVELYYFGGLSVAETGEALGLGMEAVKARLFRARKRLAETLAPQPSRRSRGII